MAEAPPMPGQPSAFLTAGGYGAGRSRTALDIDDDDDAGVSNFHQFASPDFGGGVLDGQDEAIGRRGGADMTRDEEWDLEELGKEGFDVNDFMRRTLTGADDEEVKRLKAALMRQKGANAREQQRNVFKQYVPFQRVGANHTESIATLSL
jgi:hypothetical protein